LESSSESSTNVFDFHCHLDLYSPSELLLTHVKASEFVFAVTTTPLAVAGNKSRFGEFLGIKIGCGLHPELVESRGGELPLLLDQIKTEVFVGEVGIDGSSAHRRSLSGQVEVFTSVIRQCGVAGGKVVSIHSRNAVGQILDILEGNRPVGYPVFHWFSGTPNQALRAAKLGAYFSVNGPAVLSRTGRQWVEAVPRHRILTETDGPFCGDGSRPLWPGEISGAIAALSEVWKVSKNEAFEQVRENARLFLSKVA